MVGEMLGIKDYTNRRYLCGYFLLISFHLSVVKSWTSAGSLWGNIGAQYIGSSNRNCETCMIPDWKHATPRPTRYRASTSHPTSRAERPQPISGGVPRDHHLDLQRPLGSLLLHRLPFIVHLPPPSCRYRCHLRCRPCVLLDRRHGGDLSSGTLNRQPWT